MFILRFFENSPEPQPRQLQVANTIDGDEHTDEQDRVDHKVGIGSSHHAKFLNEKIIKADTHNRTEHRKNNDYPVLLVII